MVFQIKQGGGNKKVENEKYYQILGVSKTATADEMRKAYRRLAAKMHPDKGGEQEKVKIFNNIL